LDVPKLELVDPEPVQVIHFERSVPARNYNPDDDIVPEVSGHALANEVSIDGSIAGGLFSNPDAIDLRNPDKPLIFFSRDVDAPTENLEHARAVREYHEAKANEGVKGALRRLIQGRNKK
jgi:hypothetical protein